MQLLCLYSVGLEIKLDRLEYFVGCCESSVQLVFSLAENVQIECTQYAERLVGT